MPCKSGWILITYAVFLVLLYSPQSGGMGPNTDLSSSHNPNGIQNNEKSSIVPPSSTEPSPDFIIEQTLVTVAPSQMAVLPCTVRNLGERQVVWRRIKDDEFLTIGKMVWSKDPRILVEYSAKGNGVTSWDLLMRNVVYDDAGLYECQVTSSELIIWNVELKVVEPVTYKPKSRVHKEVITQAPHYVTAKMQAADHQRTPPHKEEFVTAGLPIRLMCNTSLGNQSQSRSTIEWYKDGESLESNHHVLLTRYQFEADRTYVSELIIDQSQLADSGVYLCRMKDNDIFVVRIYVLPNTTLGSAITEDQSQYYAVDSLKKENGAVPVSVSSWSWAVFAFCFLHAFAIVITRLPLIYRNCNEVCACTNKNKLCPDPT